MAKRKIAVESESDSGSDNLDDAPKANTKAKAKARSSNSTGGTFGVARDPTPETPTEDVTSSDEVTVAVPARRKQKGNQNASEEGASSATKKVKGSKANIESAGQKREAKKSKFFEKKKSEVKSRPVSAFGVGHDESDSDEPSSPEASESEASESEPSPKKQKKKTKSPAKTKVQPTKDFQVKLGQPQIETYGHAVPPGHISKSTMQFLQALQLETCNDREWFALHDPQYRHAWKQWLDFVQHTFNPSLQHADPEIPELPPKDLVHRIYRDVRFSSDKRPYKTVLTASTSRGGRKAHGFASYYVQVGGGRSLLAAGIWCPDKDTIATIRHNITHNDVDLFRQVISAPSFVAMFGPPEPLPRPSKPKKPRKKKAKKDEDLESDKEEEEEEPEPEPEPSRRQNIFGHEDELVNAPKGYPKDHPLIDLLRLRTIAVSRSFTDQEVQASDFGDKLRETAEEMAPFVHILNDMMTPNGLPPNPDGPIAEEGTD